MHREDPSVGGNVENRIPHRLHKVTAYICVLSREFSLQFDMLEGPFNDRFLAHLFTLLFAGHETTLAALSWVIYYLGKHDKYRQRIKEEFEQLGGQINRQTLQKGEI